RLPDTTRGEPRSTRCPYTTLFRSVLNAVELAITEATIANDHGESLRGVPTMDEAAERCRIAFPRHLAPGAWRLRLVFTGHLNDRSEEHTSELQSRFELVCRLLLDK